VKLETRVAVVLGLVAALAVVAGALAFAAGSVGGDTGRLLGIGGLAIGFLVGLAAWPAATWLVGQLSAAVTELRQALAGISETSEALVQSSRRYAAGSEQQAAAVGEISGTVERLSVAAQQIAQGARQATAAAAEGRGAVDATARGVAAIRAAVETAVDRGRSLRSGSQRVGDVADTISNIAERTHILALNASIEAASAGEYGRRFAVVAGQVRELAGDTRQATEQVKATLAELRGALAALEASGQEARELAGRVDDQAQRAAGSIADVVRIVETIARATVSQQTASAELVATMRGIVEVSRDSVESSRLAAEGAGRIAETAARLGRLVAQFRPGGA